jgi:hypothetical protein
MKTWNIRYLDGFSYLGRPTTQVRAIQAETKAAAAALCGNVQIVRIWEKKERKAEYDNVD